MVIEMSNVKHRKNMNPLKSSEFDSITDVWMFTINDNESDSSIELNIKNMVVFVYISQINVKVLIHLHW